jgi:Tfp pilus assembly protein PilV
MRASSSKGISIVEIIVAAAIIGTTVIGIVGAIQVYLKIVHQNARETQAVLLLDETAEALQYLRDDSFSGHIATAIAGDEYTLFWNGTGYELGTSTITLPYDMTRTVVFSEVERDASDQIVTSGTEDDSTRLATITVEWPYKEEIKSISAQMLIHDMYAN